MLWGAFEVRSKRILMSLQGCVKPAELCVTNHHQLRHHSAAPDNSLQPLQHSTSLCKGPSPLKNPQQLLPSLNNCQCRLYSPPSFATLFNSDDPPPFIVFYSFHSCTTTLTNTERLEKGYTPSPHSHPPSHPPSSDRVCCRLSWRLCFPTHVLCILTKPQAWAASRWCRECLGTCSAPNAKVLHHEPDKRSRLTATGQTDVYHWEDNRANQNITRLKRTG